MFERQILEWKWESHDLRYKATENDWESSKWRIDGEKGASVVDGPKHLREQYSQTVCK
jgi:hypothetical protein